MPKKVLLSIKPEFAEKILDGRKKFEFRRVVFRDKTVREVVIYASSPVSQIVGEFEIDGILSMSKNDLWRETQRHAGITRDIFMNYFDGKDECYAIRVANPVRYDEPMNLQQAVALTRPPQSYAYVEFGMNEYQERPNQAVHLTPLKCCGADAASIDGGASDLDR
jgi:predicted transcriptional regulator